MMTPFYFFTDGGSYGDCYHLPAIITLLNRFEGTGCHVGGHVSRKGMGWLTVPIETRDEKTSVELSGNLFSQGMAELECITFGHELLPLGVVEAGHGVGVG